MSKEALTCELILRSHQMKPCMSYSPCTQLSNLQSAPGSLILHHGYAHSRCSVKFSARSAHSQVLRGKNTLAFDGCVPSWAQLCQASTPDGSLQNHASKEHSPSRWRENPPALASRVQSPRKCKLRIILLIFILSWPHQKENSCKQPHPCFIVWGGVGRVEKKPRLFCLSLS